MLAHMGITGGGSGGVVGVLTETGGEALDLGAQGGDLCLQCADEGVEGGHVLRQGVGDRGRGFLAHGSIESHSAQKMAPPVNGYAD